MSRSKGDSPATTAGIIDYLVDNYTDLGQPIAREQAQALVMSESEREFVQRSIVVMGSYSYYVGDQIAERAGLQEIPMEDDDEDEDDGAE
jgi:hypothetical protein